VAAAEPPDRIVTELEHQDDAAVDSSTDATRRGDLTVDTFTAPEKLASIAHAITSRPTRDPKVNALLAMLTSGLGRRLVLDRALELLPPLDQPDEWDQWLALLVGCALELTSDGVELDVDACREIGRQTIMALFTEGM
jgi:hypothetical protein